VFEWVHGNRYGTLMAPLESAISNKKVMLLDVDVKGSCTLMEEFEDNIISIFIEPPGINDSDKKELLLERMINRGNENETLYKQRLRRFEFEIGFKDKFDCSFINDNLDKTTDKIEKLIKEKI
jgi:guanylate kinase